MDKATKRKETLKELAAGIKVVDLDLEPEPQTPTSASVYIKKEYDLTGDSSVPIKLEPGFSPFDLSSWGNNTKANPFIIMDDDTPTIVSPAPATLPAFPDPPVSTASHESPDQPNSLPNVPTSLPDQDHNPMAATVEDAMDVDDVRAQAEAHQSDVQEPPEPTVSNPSASSTTPAVPESNRNPIQRVATATHKINLKAAQQAMAQKSAIKRKQTAQQEQEVEDEIAPASKSRAKTGSNATKPPARPKKAARTSSGDEAYRPRGAKGKATAAIKARASGGDYPSDHDSSDGDEDDDHAGSDDQGLFVGDRDEDGDIEMDDEQLAEREGQEFISLKKRMEKAKKLVKKNEKKKIKSDDALEAEIIAIKLEQEYEAARQRRQAANAPDQDTEDEDDEHQFFGQGIGDVGEDELFENFEDRNKAAAVHPEPIIESDDEEGALEQFDRLARADRRRLGMGKSADDGPDDELLGSRKKPNAGRKPRGRKLAGAGKARKKKGKAGGDQVQDGRVEKAAVGQKSKKGKKQPPSLLNMGSLWTGDVIRDAQGNSQLGRLPVLTATGREAALKKLVASLPAEHRKEAGSGRQALLAAARDFRNQRSIVAVPDDENGCWRLRDMTIPLKNHQLLGSAFMRRREKDTIEPLGGICADQMGLGKTVMMIANILDGLPTKKDIKEGALHTTLIVATNALVAQWKSEIAKFTKAKALKVLVINSQNKLSSNDDKSTIEGFDVVLTTYEEVRKSYPKEEFPIELQTAEEKQDWWKSHYETYAKVLHKVHFQRVVLDEAQQIKNHRSHTSLACRGLIARHRWALSGTPIQNSIQELYPYFKFLRVEHTGSYKIFCHNFVGNENKPSKMGITRLNQLLNRFMIRRTHADKVMGLPIVTLPKASEQIRWVKFNDVERSVYEIVRARMIKRINRLSRSKELDANYSHVLTMLLRLRQLTGHILTVEAAMRDLLEEEDHQKIYDLAEIECTPAKTNLRHLQLKRLRALIAKNAKEDKHNKPGRTKFPGVRNRARYDSANESDSDDSHLEPQDIENLPDRDNIGGRHGLEYDFLRYLKTLRDARQVQELQKRTVCAYCGDPPAAAQITSCYHVYCQDCLEVMMEDSAAAGQDNARCKECGCAFTTTQPVDDMDFDKADAARRMRQLEAFGSDYEEESESDVEMSKADRRWKSGGKRQHKKKKPDWIEQEGKNILPSAKTTAIKAQVLNWLAENPNVKIIIFTQFINMIRIMERVCQGENWPYTLYHGGLVMAHRQENIKNFQDNPHIRILLSSLKAGGIGLNLTMAQKVIVVDPWWNSSVEQQAFCRVFRIGQDQETAMTRFVVENTVDQNMIAMQRRKQEEIDKVMDPSKRGDQRLGLKDLLKLFGGEVAEDEDGQPFIFVETKDTRRNPLAGDEDIADEE